MKDIKGCRIVLLFALLVFTVLGEGNAQLNIIEKNGQQIYSISIPVNASENEKYAASELQKYVELSSGVTIPILNSISSESNNQIRISHSDKFQVDESFTINLIGNSRVEITGAGRGVVYAIYELLEYWGFRYYASDGLVIPKLSRLIIPKDYNVIWTPSFTLRDLYYSPTFDNLYLDWHRINHNSIGRVPQWSNLWAHTSLILVPPNTYFSTNPSFYALRGGQRKPTELCYTNDTVLSIVINNLKKYIGGNPSAVLWSVSQADNVEFCECDNCVAVYNTEGAYSGTILRFVNKVAQAFPDKVISTLAYQYSQKPPKVTKAASNVNIMLSDIKVDRSRPIVDSESDAAKEFIEDLQGWTSICNDVLIWDYLYQFKNTLSPFPNFETLQPNLKLFQKYQVKSLFEQGNYVGVGEFDKLRSYVVSKLMINPDASTKDIVKDFCDGYYGAASEYIIEYIETITNNLIASNASLSISGTPIEKTAMDTWLSPQNLRIYHAIFDKAEEVVKQDSDKLAKVQFARQPLYYAQLEQARALLWGSDGFFIQEKDGTLKQSSYFLRTLEQFVERCKNEGVVYLSESSTTPDEYLNMMLEISTIHSKGVLSYLKPYTVTNKSNNFIMGQYRKVVLTNGLFASNDFNNDPQWFSAIDTELTVTIDLGKIENVDSVIVRCLQANYARIFYPQTIQVYLSDDNLNFKKVGGVNTMLDETLVFKVNEFKIDVMPVSTGRYVRLLIETINSNPSLYKKYAGKANLLIDEIMVK